MALAGELGPTRVLGDRELIFELGARADAAYFLSDGYVEIFQCLPDGRSLTVRVLGAPCVFGVLETCGGERAFLESTRVLEHAILHRVEVDELHRLLHQHPDAALECLATTCMAFCRVAETETARLVEAEALLAGTLLLYARLFGEATQKGQRITLKRSQADFAGVVGASERQVQRLLSDWKTQGIIDKHEGRYIVVEAQALQQRALGFEEGFIHLVDVVPAWVYSGGSLSSSAKLGSVEERTMPARKGPGG